jgi:hypothetical protein
MGWCSAGRHGEICDPDSCAAAGGDYHDDLPTNDGCRVVAEVPDEFARQMVEATVWPPVVKVRDAILPKRKGGGVMVADLDRHFDEILAIVRRDPKLLVEVIKFTSAMGPYLRAMAGQPNPADGSLAAYTSTRLRPGMIEWTADILRRFDAKASAGLKSTIKRYVAILPSLQNLTAAELLSTLDDARVVSRLQAA